MIEEHRKRAEVYRAACERFRLDGGEMKGALSYGMTVAIGIETGRTEWMDKALDVYRNELNYEVVRCPLLDTPSVFDKTILRGEILTRAAEYHEACVAAGRTL